MILSCNYVIISNQGGIDMNIQEQFIEAVFGSTDGIIEINGNWIQRKYVRNAIVCLTSPDIKGNINLLISACEMTYDEAYNIVKMYKDMDNRDFACNMKNEFFQNGKIKLISIVALKMQQVFDIAYHKAYQERHPEDLNR